MHSKQNVEAEELKAINHLTWYKFKAEFGNSEGKLGRQAKLETGCGQARPGKKQERRLEGSILDDLANNWRKRDWGMGNR